VEPLVSLIILKRAFLPLLAIITDSVNWQATSLARLVTPPFP